MMAELKKSTSEHVLYRGQLIELVVQEMSDGRLTKTFEFARRGPGTRIIFFDGSKILLTREYRYESERFDIRLPGGKIFDTLNDYEHARSIGLDMTELATRTIAREAAEEVGLKPVELRCTHKSICGATIVWDLYYFLCMSWEKMPSQRLEVGESITFDWYPVPEVRGMCLSGQISEERSAIAILRTLHDLVGNQ
jgi:hypothetical protein